MGTVSEAIAAVKVADCLKFFLTTFPTNMLKFPVFEVINTILAGTSLSGSIRGVVNGALFCTLMLPVTNYRFRKSMNLPIELGLLYQAYPPTVGRDIVYGWSRGTFGGIIARAFGDSLGQSFAGQCIMFGMTIWIACIVSSPFNEWRGYWLQPPARKLPFDKFFQPARYARSTGVGATIMFISLSAGMFVTPEVKQTLQQLQGVRKRKCPIQVRLGPRRSSMTFRENYSQSQKRDVVLGLGLLSCLPGGQFAFSIAIFVAMEPPIQQGLILTAEV